MRGSYVYISRLQVFTCDITCYYPPAAAANNIISKNNMYHKKITLAAVMVSAFLKLAFGGNKARKCAVLIRTIFTPKAIIPRCGVKTSFPESNT